MRVLKIAVLLSCTVSSLAATAAMAQGADTAAQDESSEANSTDREIIVTGSRIARRDYSSESPIVTVGSDILATTGATTLEQSLNTLPQVTTSASSSSNFNSRAGQANVNLRGLGQQRTLVLVNGRRMQPSGNDGSVDLNLIPAALIDNIEIITGGASSTYGSDAVSGVVNIKLKKRFAGVQLDGTVASTFRGDGANNSVGITMGSDFADKSGNAWLSLNFSDRGPVSFVSRDYLAGQVLSTNHPGGLITAVATNLPTQAAFNSVFGGYGVTGTVSRSSTLSLNTDGTLYVGTGAINYRGSRSSPYRVYNNNVYTIAGDYFLAQVPLTRYNAMGHIDYEFEGGTRVFLEGLYTHYKATTQGNPLVVGSVSSLPIAVPMTNPFISPDLRTILDSRPNSTADFLIAQAVVPAGNRHEENVYDVFQITGGAEGRIGTNLTWNVHASHGRTVLNQYQRNYLSSLAIQRLVSAPDGGASLCAGGYNFVDVSTLSQSCLAYIKRDAHNRTELEQTIVEANVQGGIATLPAGEVRFALGADYRRNSYSFEPDALIRTGELANYLPIYPSAGSDTVKEIYGELLVPIVRDAFFAKELTLNLGFRHSDYKVSGGVDTYKASADWGLTDWLKLRGGYARAVRAPSVGELYTAVTNGLFNLGAPGSLGSGDPCDVRGAYRTGGDAAQVRALCLAQGVPTVVIDSFQNTVSRTPFTTSGNLDLKPETADTWSIGAVFRSTASNPLFARLSLSVDYYNIRLKDAIGVVTNTVAASQCFNPAVNSGYSESNYFCSLMTRDPNTGLITNIVNPQLNLGGYKTSGIDVAADWSIPLDELGLGDGSGRLNLATVVSYLDSFKIQTLPGGTTLDYAGTIGNQQIDFFGTAKPRWKATSSIGWSGDRLGALLRWRYLGKMANARNVGTAGTLHGVPSVSYFDLDLSANVAENFELRGGIVNLFDRKPPTLNDSLIGAYATDPFTYDLVGRRFYISAKARF
ncbi:TonB-dependent receptor [Sphingopyxis sp. SCN 67-31]|uniref:TonB-dependent receptor domain-containing protein n=1 Tax=Sphingopyxis sp. SCN 67-31 TaxID=1660142 RepID=UPI00086F801E|nr:TonB-dependent receptor [Sphingopyxis sp. SCN 67-31]ODU27248.1 MAG: hypothetical protein ABS88_16760 [Sphingopyxis sp. SCN 67-31]